VIEDSDVAGEPALPRADFEVDAGWEAKAVRSRRAANARTRTRGDIDEVEELTEAKPKGAEGKRWRVRAWLRSSKP
jgi:hypothetical protein